MGKKKDIPDHALYNLNRLIWFMPALMCLASTLWSDKTVTAVALTQWFVEVWGSTPAFGASSSSYCWAWVPRLGYYKTTSLRKLHMAKMDLGPWNRQFCTLWSEQRCGVFHLKHIRLIRHHLRCHGVHLDGLRGQHCTELVVSSSLRSLSTAQHLFSLTFSATFAEVQCHVKPCAS